MTVLSMFFATWTYPWDIFQNGKTTVRGVPRTCGVCCKSVGLTYTWPITKFLPFAFAERRE
eukprot:12914720-Prorocentrum_lima.AAC.1